MTKLVDFGGKSPTWPTRGVYAVTVNVSGAMTALSNSGQSAASAYPQVQYPRIEWSVASSGQLEYSYYSHYYNQTLTYPTPSSIIYRMSPWDETETAAQKAEREKRAVERLAATARAEKLLFTILTPEQVRSYKDDDYFDVPVKERIYRLRKGRAMNVELIEAGRGKIKFCAHPSDHSIPVPDVMLSQLLMLKANEAGFLQIANRSAIL